MLVVRTSWAEICWHDCSAVMAACPFRRVLLSVGATLSAITSKICHHLWQPAMNNLYEYSAISRAASLGTVFTLWGWTDCPSDSTAIKTGGQTCHDWWLVDVSCDVCSRWETVARLSLQREMTEQQISPTEVEFSHGMTFVAVLSASVVLDWDDIWSQTAGMEFLSLPFLSAACGLK